ncbi:MAG: isopentenyl-diphosphate Delta-isomerase [Candidatus Zhuqueibacterota bacterium]
MEEIVILVDSKDNEIGREEKMKAHENGVLHRAFSVFIFNRDGEMLLQQRAMNKYHSAGLWTNACCSHPRPGETIEEAAHRRLKEEMGFDCQLERKFHFIYRAEFDNGLIEHEFDHVLFGTYSGRIDFNPDEVANVRWISIEDLREELIKRPEYYTVWFKIAFEEVDTFLAQ